MVAWRIANGLDILGGPDGGGWLVGTFARDVTKVEAIRTVSKFVRWLRDGHGLYKEVVRRRMDRFERQCGRKPDREEKARIRSGVRVSLRRDIEYSCTWELQRSGRLHCNLIMAPWRYIHYTRLEAAWRRFGGGSTSIYRVGRGIGDEAAKARQEIGDYTSKLYQMVMYGRGVAYSRGWPKLPEAPFGGRKGDISWHWAGDLTEEAVLFWYERELGYSYEVSPGEWKSSDPEVCDCFELVRGGGDLFDSRSPPATAFL